MTDTTADTTAELGAVTGQDRAPSLARDSGSMAIPSLISRITGLARNIILGAVLGFGVVNDSYTVANNFPNILYEFLLGGVLASVAIPVLVQAQHEDDDDGMAFTQRLLTVSGVVLLVGTVLAVAAAPLLTGLYTNDGSGHSSPALTTALTVLILPEILFYGVFGLLSGILNARHVFKPAAWAPVLNNVVMFVTLGVYALVPGDISLNPVRMGQSKLLVLGIGTTLGIAVQAVVLVPPLLRIGFRFRWRWGWDRRLGKFGALSMWTILYVVVTQVGYVALTNVATGAASGSIALYTYSWLLLQVPYGVLGVSLLTAIMPRMSKAAARGDTGAVVGHMSTGARLSVVMLVPLCGMITVLGPQIGDALFSLGRGNGSSTQLGLTLTTSAFGLVFYAITMLQLRVFYAMNDARTPTLIGAVMILVKLPLIYACAHVLTPDHVVYGLTFVNGIGFLVASIVGELWLRHRLGRLDTGHVLRTTAKTAVAAVWGAAVALLIAKGVAEVLPPGAKFVRAWLSLLLGAGIGLAVTFGGMALLRVRELGPAVGRITRLVRR